MRVSNNTEWLFFHLWKKNPETLLPCPNIYIAETILFRWAQPYFWYYTAKDGLLVRKTKEKVLLQQIEESFLSNVPKSEIVACTMTSYEDPLLKTQEKIEFEYLDVQSFHNFLFQREKPLNIIVQKFIEPKNNKNSMIKVSWTPQFCLFFRKTNLYDMNNTKVPIANRLVTFEGMEHFSHSDSIASPILASELEQTCLNIVKHVFAVTGGNIQISKMVLYFKLDDKNRLWLLFCTGLKLREKLNTQGGAVQKKKAERPLSPIMVISTRKDDNHQKQQVPSQYLLEDQVNQANADACLRCGREDLLYDVKMKLLTEYEEKVMKGVIKPDEKEEDIEQSLENENNKSPRSRVEGVPKFMTRLYPNITNERYKKLRKNVSLMNMDVKVCEDCYLLVTSSLLENLEEHKAKKHQTHLREISKKQTNVFGLQKISEERKSTKQESPNIFSFVPGQRTGQRTSTKTLTIDSSPKAEVKQDDTASKKSTFFGVQKPIPEQHTFLPEIEQNSRSRENIIYESKEYQSPEEEQFYKTDYTKDYYLRTTTSHSNLFKKTSTSVPQSRQHKSPYSIGLDLKLPAREKSREKLLRGSRPEFFITRPITTESQTPKVWNHTPKAGEIHRNNYNSVLSTIRDLRAFLGQNLEDLET